MARHSLVYWHLEIISYTHDSVVIWRYPVCGASSWGPNQRPHECVQLKKINLYNMMYFCLNKIFVCPGQIYFVARSESVCPRDRGCTKRYYTTMTIPALANAYRVICFYGVIITRKRYYYVRRRFARIIVTRETRKIMTIRRFLEGQLQYAVYIRLLTII